MSSMSDNAGKPQPHRATILEPSCKRRTIQHLKHQADHPTSSNRTWLLSMSPPLTAGFGPSSAMSRNTMPMPSVQDFGPFELARMRRTPTTPLLNDSIAAFSSLRSSLESGYYRSQDCDVQIYDDEALEPSRRLGEGVNYRSCCGSSQTPENLQQCLKVSSP